MHLLWYGGTLLPIELAAGTSGKALPMLKGFRATCSHPDSACILQQDYTKPQTVSITAEWLHSQIVQVLNWPVQIFFQLKRQLMHHETKNAAKKTQDC